MTLAYSTDDGIPRRAGLGLVVLQRDETIEADMRRLLPADVLLYHSRIPSAAEVTREGLARMGESLAETAALLPDAAPLDALGYGCTSGAMVLGESRVAELVGASHPGAPVTNPLSALKAACAALGVARLGLVSPYVPEVADELRGALADHGLAVPHVGSFDQISDSRVARITPESIRDAVLEIGAAAECEAVFASCTNLRAVEIVASAERQLGKPVLASNQVMAWHMLRLAGIADDVPGGGTLFSRPLADPAPTPA